MNIRRGLERLWLIASAAWGIVILWLIFQYNDFAKWPLSEWLIIPGICVLPAVTALVVGEIIAWTIRGFSKTDQARFSVGKNLRVSIFVATGTLVLGMIGALWRSSQPTIAFQATPLAASVPAIPNEEVDRAVRESSRTSPNPPSN